MSDKERQEIISASTKEQRKKVCSEEHINMAIKEGKIN